MPDLHEEGSVHSGRGYRRHIQIVKAQPTHCLSVSSINSTRLQGSLPLSEIISIRSYHLFGHPRESEHGMHQL